MLVATPSNHADRKPRVISEIRKPFVQRSPSLDDLPRLSGTLNYYCNILGIWSQKQVCVREGCLLVYEDTLPFPHTPARGYASLGRPSSKRIPLQYTRSDSSSNPSVADFFGYSGSHSLGRARGAALAGLEFRLPLRHLNLMPSTNAPLAFTLSHRHCGNGTGTSLQVTFQALNELDYDRWVKTLAVEIMRQTPLDAIRFLDVMGIASLSTPTTKSFTLSPAVRTVTKTNLDKSISDSSITNAASTKIRWDRSPSSEGSTTSTDFSVKKDNKHEIHQSILSRPKRFASNGDVLVGRKLSLKDIDSDKEEQCYTTVTKDQYKDTHKRLISNRKSREKVRRFRAKNGEGSSSEETKTVDEGIVMEERGSSSERSCRRTLWPSDRSDCLDSPHSVSSYSSYELCESPEITSLCEDVPSNDEGHTKNASSVDEPDCKAKINNDQTSERMYCKNIVSPITYQKNLLKKKCEKVGLGRTISEGKKIFLEAMSQNSEDHCKSLMDIPIFRAQPCQVTEINPQLVDSGSGDVSTSKKSVPVSGTCSPNDHKGTWNRARSCSPNNRLSGYDERGGRALSVGLPLSKRLYSCVELLKQRCQNTENYVPVKEKLVLFESLCSAGRLARSSEELAIDFLQPPTPRARSLHDLTRERSPHVREICEFFEKFGNSKQTSSNTNEHVNLITKQKPHKEKQQKENSTKNQNDQSHCYESTETLIHKQIVPKSKSMDYSDHNFNFNTIKFKVKAFDNVQHKNDSVKNSNSLSSINNVKLQNDTSLCNAFQYGQFKQIRLGNKIITYV